MAMLRYPLAQCALASCLLAFLSPMTAAYYQQTGADDQQIETWLDSLVKQYQPDAGQQQQTHYFTQDQLDYIKNLLNKMKPSAVTDDLKQEIVDHFFPKDSGENVTQEEQQTTTPADSEEQDKDGSSEEQVTQEQQTTTPADSVEQVKQEQTTKPEYSEEETTQQEQQTTTPSDSGEQVKQDSEEQTTQQEQQTTTPADSEEQVKESSEEQTTQQEQHTTTPVDSGEQVKQDSEEQTTQQEQQTTTPADSEEQVKESSEEQTTQQEQQTTTPADSGEQVKQDSEEQTTQQEQQTTTPADSEEDTTQQEQQTTTPADSEEDTTQQEQQTTTPADSEEDTTQQEQQTTTPADSDEHSKPDSEEEKQNSDDTDGNSDEDSTETTPATTTETNSTTTTTTTTTITTPTTKVITTPEATTTTTTTTEPVTNTTTTTIGTITTVKPSLELCNNCVVHHGVGYAPFPGYCDAYIQCRFYGALPTAVDIRRCPSGNYWNQDKLICDFQDNVKCTSVNNCPNHKAIPGDWAAYSIFNGNTWTRVACPDRRTYNSVTCGCTDIIGGFDGNHEICTDKKAVIGDKTGFMQFTGNGWVRMACPATLGYNEQTCRCTDKLSPDTSSKVCPNTKPIPGDKSGYLQFTGVSWIRRPCPATLVYHTDKCVCSYDETNNVDNDDGQSKQHGVCKATVALNFDSNDATDSSVNHFWVNNTGVTFNDGKAYFNGKSRLTIPGLSNMEFGSTVYIFIKYRHSSANSQQTLVSNGDCQVRQSLAVCSGKASVDFYAETKEQISLGKTTVPSDVGAWQYAVYALDNGNLLGSVGANKIAQPVKGAVDRRPRGLVIGGGGGCDNFHGIIDDVRVYLCKPEL